MSNEPKTIFGMKVQVNPNVPPGEVWLVGPPRFVNGVEVRDRIKITNIEVPSPDPEADGGS